MIVAKTAASGGNQLLPQVLEFSTSLKHDLRMLDEDLLGSLAHVVMLGRRGLIPLETARALHGGLLAIAANKHLELPLEEDVHMAVEAQLKASLGAPAALLHTARSRNDQVATDLHLHVREQCRKIALSLADCLELFISLAEPVTELILPSYTHRQRAQPVSLAYFYASYAYSLERDAQAFMQAAEAADSLPLGVGAIAGTSLPIDRELVQGLLGFSRLSANGLDTVGNHDFALDYFYASARLFVHLSRLATDMVDFTTSEFGFATLDGQIACGSSMMPQKRNPDVFELIRGRSARAIGHLNSLLVMLKGVPGGYNRDLQENRQPLLDTGVMTLETLQVLQLALPRVKFDAQRCLDAVSDGSTQATDLAEALVQQGVPFREAYQLVGAFVHACRESKVPMAQAPLSLAKSIDPRLDAKVLERLNPKTSLTLHASPGGPSPVTVRAQLDDLRARAQGVKEAASKIPSLAMLFSRLQQELP